MKYPLGSPDIQEGDIQAAVDVLRTGWLVQGKNVEQLEQSIAQFCKVNHAVCASNGTATMHLCLKLLEVTPEDEVIVPAFSYIATANVIELVNAKPVFVDIELDTFNLNPKITIASITPSTKVILPVHEFGLMADLDLILHAIKNTAIFLIEDAACALGATDLGRSAGSLGDFGSFSLHPRKAITSGEGGVITTNSSKWANTLKTLRNHGISKSNGKQEFVMAGFNYRMTDFQAALVLSQFQRLDNILKIKRQLAKIYLSEIKNPTLKLPSEPQGKEHTWQTFHVLAETEQQRDTILSKLKDKGIGSNYGAQCIPAQLYYRQKYGYEAEKEFPNAYKAYTCGFALPIYEKLTTEDIRYITRVVNTL